MQIIIHGKSQIRLTAAKVNNMHRMILGQEWPNVLNKLQKTVDLTELIVPRRYHFSFFGLHSQIHQKGNRTSFFQNIAFLSVVGQRNLNVIFRNAALLFAHRHFSFFAYQHRRLKRGCLNLQLFKAARKIGFQNRCRLLRRVIFMKYLRPAICGDLKQKPVL